MVEEQLDVEKEQLSVTKEQLQFQKLFAKKKLSKEEAECHQLFGLTHSSQDVTYEWYKGQVSERVAMGLLDTLAG